MTEHGRHAPMNFKRFGIWTGKGTGKVTSKVRMADVEQRNPKGVIIAFESWKLWDR